MQISLTEAKAQLSKLIEKALVGEEAIISKYGKPMVKLVPVWEGEAWTEEDFNDLSKTLKKAFAVKTDEPLS